MFSKACEYGIRSCIYIAKESLLETKISLKEVAKAIESPPAYTSKILQLLSRNSIINSEKGPTGGFFMNENQLNTFTLSSIVAAIDGDSIYTGCGLGLKNCNELKPCPLHNQFKSVRNELRNMLETTLIKELAIETKSGGYFLKL